jgi:hypothetical protein
MKLAWPNQGGMDWQIRYQLGAELEQIYQAEAMHWQ